MTCKNCKTKNITKAHYCKNCGHPFTQADRDKAYNRTIFGVIKNLRKLKSYATLSVITGKPWFKAITLVVILLYGLVQVKTNGNEIKIMPSEFYDVQYNTVNDEYYITSEHQQIGVNLYLPKQTSEITVNQLGFDGIARDTESYNAEDSIILTYQDNVMYNIQADFEAGGSQRIKIYFINE